MPYGVYHVDKFAKILLKLVETEGEAVNYVLKEYAGRFMPGRDFVHIVGPDNKIVSEYQVSYMAQFEAKKKWLFPSKSKPKKPPYETRLTTLDMLSCNCQGWTMYTPAKKAKGPRCCSHIDIVVAQEGYQTTGIGQYLYLVNTKLKQAKAALVKTPQAIFAKLIADYEKAIDHMSSLDPSQVLSAIPAVEQAKFRVEIYMEKLEQLGIDGAEQYHAAQSKLKQALA